MEPKSTKFFDVSKSILSKSEKMFIEVTGLKRKIVPYDFKCTLCSIEYTIRCWFVKGNNNSKETIVTSHGFGKSSTQAQWCLVAEKVFEDDSILHVCLPGFGNSSGRTLQTRKYKRDQVKLFAEILKMFKSGNKGITVLGQCGSGGIMFRTFSKYPHLFAKRHFFGRPYVSNFKDLELMKKLKMNKTTFWIRWHIDRDHMTCSVPFKFYKKNSKEFPKRLIFDPIKEKCSKPENDWLGGKCLPIKKFSRAEYVFYYDPSIEAVNELKKFFRKM